MVETLQNLALGSPCAPPPVLLYAFVAAWSARSWECDRAWARSPALACSCPRPSGSPRQCHRDAGGHRLRRHVRRLDHSIRCYSRRGGLGDDLIDGYAMARKGRAGSGAGHRRHRLLHAGTVSVVALMLLAHRWPTSRSVSAPEYFALLSSVSSCWPTERRLHGQVAGVAAGASPRHGRIDR